MKSQKEINQAFKELAVCNLEGIAPWEVFIQEYGYNIARLGEQESVKQWMLGLPSLLSMPFTYHEIGEWLEANTGLQERLDCFDSDVQDARYWTKAAMIFIKTYKPKNYANHIPHNKPHTH